jgi:16S rRNA (guanine527-N7)-methyltransferase
MNSYPTSRIKSLAEKISTDFPALDTGVVFRYLEDVVRWNEHVPLVSRQSTLSVLDRLVRQSALLYDFARRYDDRFRPEDGCSVVDIGTGAGFPGLVWKLSDPGLRVTLVERKRKKVTFLERMKVALQVDEIEIVEGDASEVAQHDRFRGQFEVATSFAVGTPAEVTRIAGPFLGPGGCYLSARPKEESVEDAPRGFTLETTEETDYGRFCLFRKLSH